MSRITKIDDLRIEPVLMLEPPGMFDDNSPYPKGRKVVQDLFRRSVAGTALANLRFVEGSDLLLSTRDLLPLVDSLAKVRSQGVSSIGDAELAGGYAFMNGADYAFGVEDDSTLFDTVRWDESVNELLKDGSTRVRHACDQFVEAKLVKETVALTHERSKRQYLVSFERFQTCIASASDELHKFAIAFVPAYEKELTLNMPPAQAHRAAYDSFKNRPHWFASS